MYFLILKNSWNGRLLNSHPARWAAVVKKFSEQYI